MKDTVTAMGWAPAAVGARFDRSVAAAKTSRRFQLYEYAYYFIVFYALVGPAVGISLGSIGIAMHLGLALLCIFRVRSGALELYRPLTSMILCSVWFVGVQLVVHHSSLTQDYIRPFLAFVLALFIVQSLATRPGFLQRALLAIFIIGLTALPFLDLERIDGRAGSSAVGFGNPNDLAAWFGFCAVAFLVRGLETRKSISRWVCFGISLFSVFMVALTVGRGALAAFAVAALIAFRKRLKRGFLPVLGVVVLVGAAFAYGLFDNAIERYIARGTEDTGRVPVWSIAVQKVVESPIFGVPIGEIGTEFNGNVLTPHNGLLLIALGGGILPLLLFLAHWWRCLRGAVQPSIPGNSDSAYLLPLLVYSFLIVIQLNEAFMTTWCSVTVCACLHNLAVSHRVQLSGLRARWMERTIKTASLKAASPRMRIGN